MGMELYLVRHAEAVYEPNDEVGRGLTPAGRRDAAWLVELFSDKSIDAVVSSPYARAIETVEGIARHAGCPLTIEEDFRERRLAGPEPGGRHLDDFEQVIERLWAE